MLGHWGDTVVIVFEKKWTDVDISTYSKFWHQGEWKELTEYITETLVHGPVMREDKGPLWDSMIRGLRKHMGPKVDGIKSHGHWNVQRMYVPGPPATGRMWHPKQEFRIERRLSVRTDVLEDLLKWNGSGQPWQVEHEGNTKDHSGNMTVWFQNTIDLAKVAEDRISPGKADETHTTKGVPYALW